MSRLAALFAAIGIAAGCSDMESERLADAAVPSAVDAAVRPDVPERRPDAPELDARSVADSPTPTPPDAVETSDAPSPPDVADAPTPLPTAWVSYSSDVPTRTATTFDGSASFDPLGRPLSYRWEMLSAPAGSTAAIGDADRQLASFTPDRDGSYEIQLTVSAAGDSDETVFFINANNVAPTFVTAPTAATYTGTAIDVTATAIDANGDAVTYRWTVKSVPDGSNATISPSTSTPGAAHLAPDVDGTYVLVVIASDGRLESSPTDVTVSSYHPLTRLQHRIIDAEAAKSIGRIILVDDEPPALYIFDPATTTEVTVPLAQAPTSVSVSPDGHHAAVGHDANISYVDLVNAKVVKIFPVTIPVLDVILAGNGYIYAFPAVDQWASLHVVDLQTGYESQTDSTFTLYAGTVGKLHPDGNRIYAADNYLTPQSLFDYSLATSASPTEMLWPYWGDYAPCGDLWFSEDGERILTACGQSFRATTDAATDMTYAGSLAGSPLGRILEASHSTTTSKFFVIRATDFFGDTTLDREVWVFGDQYLELDKRQALGGFVVNGAGFAAHGRFVFPDADGSHYHVFVEADPTSALLEDYAVTTYAF